MRTRSGSLYRGGGGEMAAVVGQRRKRSLVVPSSSSAADAAADCCGGGHRKRLAGGPNYLDELPDDLVLTILSKLAASASSPSDLFTVHLTCKRLNGLGRHDMVFAKASPASLAVKVASWSDQAQRFLKRCADAGNLEACYILGMIRFYCLGSRSGGRALLARAADGGHAAALYSLAVIQFNGSGGDKSDRDLRAGAELCKRAAKLGHLDALRELGHCLQDGYGVPSDPAEGRRLLVAANTRELALALFAAASHRPFASLREVAHCIQDGYGVRRVLPEGRRLVAANAREVAATLATAASHRPLAALLLGGAGGGSAGGCPLLSDFGWSLPEAEPHPANQFMVDWWASRGVQSAARKPGIEAEATGDSYGDELRLCSYVRCGRIETRWREFRRCSVCGKASYCSRACQALDWKRAHRAQCMPMDRWPAGVEAVAWIRAGGEAQ